MNFTFKDKIKAIDVDFERSTEAKYYPTSVFDIEYEVDLYVFEYGFGGIKNVKIKSVSGYFRSESLIGDYEIKEVEFKSDDFFFKYDLEDLSQSPFEFWVSGLYIDLRNKVIELL
jgi:hypothetical protein